MAKRKVIYVQFVEAPSVPAIGLGGDSSLSESKAKGIDMFTGIETDFLTLIKGNVNAGVPLANVKGLVWERVNDK